MKSVVATVGMLAATVSGYSPLRYPHFPRANTSVPAKQTTLTVNATQVHTSLPPGMTTTTTDFVSSKTLTMTIGTGTGASVVTTTIHSTTKQTVTIPCSQAEPGSKPTTSPGGKDEHTATTTVASKVGSTNAAGVPSSGSDCRCPAAVTVTAPASTVYVTVTADTTKIGKQPTIISKTEDGNGEDYPEPTTTLHAIATVAPYPTGNGTHTSGTAGASSFAPSSPPPQQTTSTSVVQQPHPTPPKTTTTTQPDPGSKPGSFNLGDYEQTMLDQHNIHRRNHSAPDLVWDQTLAMYAQNTGKSCVFQHDMNQGGGGYGQNLASWGGTGDINSLKVKSAASGVTEQWYNGEMSSWQFYGRASPPSNSNLHDWGHFTQVVWKSSAQVGCATVKCAAGTVLSFDSWYTVCNYNPPGNYGGEYGNNVLEPLGAKTVIV